MTGGESSDLRAHLIRRIHAEGPLPLADVMATALTHPRFGYYATRDPFGVSGDFITAPEISQMFGELIGLWAAVAWQAMGAPSRLALVELGPGRGTLMADALRAGRSVPGFCDAVQIHLVEASPSMRTLQGKALVSSGFAPVWHDTVGTLPDLPMVLIANEFFDALPVQQLVRRNRRWHERRIGLDRAGDALAWTEAPGPSPLEVLVDPTVVRTAGEGEIMEVCPSGLSIARSLGERLAARSGVCLVIDYGYSKPATGDSLQALRGHRFADILTTLGAADLTAHVDFATLNRAAAEGGATAYGPVAQGALLQALGIDARVAVLTGAATSGQVDTIMAARHRLIDPAEMGTLFKAVAWTSSDMPIPVGF
ncbi:MAG: SAM-dependent methyltransferase [Alphaproteobacteria bacterium]|nr:SAM-dependent methyltransferase [Alphaproteobacteria bacterium]